MGLKMRIELWKIELKNSPFVVLEEMLRKSRGRRRESEVIHVNYSPGSRDFVILVATNDELAGQI